MKFYDRIKIWLPNIEKYLIDMEICEQDVEYHAEGNVLIHTLMVLDEVEKLDINKDDKEILRWVALLHDIGKPYVSTIEDGKIRSHGHSKRSYHIAMELLEETHLDKNTKLEILNLVKLHGKASWAYEKEDVERYIMDLSMSCRLDLLYYFSTCDFKGRIADDIDVCLERIEIFKDVASELGCFGNPYNFSSKIAKFNYLVKRTHHYLDNPYDDTKSKVFMVCGLPGVGKDTYINKSLSWLPVISLDDIRKELGIKPTDEQGKVIQTAKERARVHMRKGEDFVWNATNVTKRLRSSIISFFVEYNSYIDMTFLHKPLEQVLEQNKNRDESVPVPVIMKLYNKLEIPTYKESHELNIILQDN